ncbi:MAG: hypothetical protein V1798_01915 [Pseudomonadota bacterium]
MRIRSLLLSLACIALWTACAAPRQPAPAPEFKNLEKKDLSDAMWKLAVGAASLRKILAEPDATTRAHRHEVVDQLKEMEKTARKLGGGEVHTNHPEIDQHIGRFIADIAEARKGAEHSPPNYFGAGVVSGGCGYCHLSQTKDRDRSKN